MKMVGVFRRSLSFPNKINPGRPAKPPISYHTRSISLPCRSHPLISHLKDEISQLKSWLAVAGTRTTAWISDGLNRLKDLHDSLAEFIQLPQSHASLLNRPVLVENLLEDLLRFVDAFGIFQTSLLALRDLQSDVHVAVRRRDDPKIVSILKSRDKTAREISRLATALRSAKTVQVITPTGSFSDAELSGVVCDVIEVTVSVSVAVFNCVGASFVSSSKTTSFARLLGLIRKEKKANADGGIEELKRFGAESLKGLRRKKEEEVRVVLREIRELAEGISGIENVSERVFRSLINTRVSLLNALTIE